MEAAKNTAAVSSALNTIRENSDTMSRVGPGTPMGEAMRRFWMPALISSELQPDGAPLRLRMLGEDLVAFRDTNGKVGLVDAYCPHKRAPLFFGRNEKCGLRCVYHGWKFDVEGNCKDIPNIVPPDNYDTLVKRMKITAYETAEAGGVVWAYMGPKDKKPALPMMEWMGLPPEYVHVSRWLQRSNWIQGMEGELDTAHISFLHLSQSMGDTLSRGAALAQDGAPQTFVKDTDYGFFYAARRRFENQFYWRITHWMLPMWSAVPPTPEFYFGHGRGWSPIDDYTTTTFAYRYRVDKPLDETDWKEINEGVSFPPLMERGTVQMPNGHVIDTYLPTANKTNDYRIDRELQRGVSFSGVYGINTQDRGLQESMPGLSGEPPGFVDRAGEHLVASDMPVIAARRKLVKLAQDTRKGIDPVAVQRPESYQVRGLAKLSPIADFEEFYASVRSELEATYLAPVASAANK
jgi:phenylpropionate dioxygenase-like ring-hydroxylating dioxygenase large terminal subunit